MCNMYPLSHVATFIQGRFSVVISVKLRDECGGSLEITSTILIDGDLLMCAYEVLSSPHEGGDYSILDSCRLVWRHRLRHSPEHNKLCSRQKLGCLICSSKLGDKLKHMFEVEVLMVSSFSIKPTLGSKIFSEKNLMILCYILFTSSILICLKHPIILW